MNTTEQHIRDKHPANLPTIQYHPSVWLIDVCNVGVK